jgi:hypothetical protein
MVEQVTQLDGNDPMSKVKEPTSQELTRSNDEIIQLAKETLQAICRDPMAPANARGSCARTLLELCGAIKNNVQDQGVGTHREMTLVELDEAIERLSSIDRSNGDGGRLGDGANTVLRKANTSSRKRR